MRLLRLSATRLWLVALLVCVWEPATRAIDASYFPPPSRIAERLYDVWFSGPVSSGFLTEKAIDDFSSSLSHLFAGWAVASAAGLALGVLVGRSRTAGYVLDPALQFLRAVPPPTLAPFFIVVFQVGAKMQIAIIVFGVIWPVLLNTIDGVRATDPLQLDTARVFGITGARRLFLIILPAAGPKIFAGLRISLALALILMVISELIGSTSGIGSFLIGAQRDFEIPSMWAGIVVLGVLGFLFNTVFLLVERRLLGWHSGAQRLDA